jgi:glycosyltransferase involved in cell wall biosynthesis
VRWEPTSGALGSVNEIRVLRLFSRLNVGGPAIHVILLTAGLGPRGYCTRLVVGRESPREGNLLDLAHQRGVECRELAPLGREVRPLADLRALWALLRMIRSFRPDIVHTHTAKAGVLGRTAARLLGVPVVVHTYHGHVLRGYFGPLKTALFRGLERRLARWSDVLVAVSDSVKQDLVRIGVAPAEKIRVVPLGLDLGGLRGELPRGGLRRVAGVSDSVPLVGIVGRLAPIKDLPTFLQASILVRRVRPETRFAVVGDGEERDGLEREARRLGLGDTVHFHGWRRDMEAVYGDLDVVVNCSRNEGTPVALIEALAAGRPVVATRVGGTPDLLGDGAYGLLVPSEDAEGLAQAIVSVLSEPESARRRTEAGRSYVLRQHSADRLIDDLDRLYRDLLAPHTRAA